MFISAMAKGKPMSNIALLATLKRMGRTKTTAHGFRSTFRYWVADTTAFANTVVKMALAHAIGALWKLHFSAATVSSEGGRSRPQPPSSTRRSPPLKM